MSWNPIYALLIAGSTGVTWIGAIILGKLKDKPSMKASLYQKVTLIICILIDLGILALYKYGGFILDTCNTILSYLHITMIQRRFDLLLPVGISFYIFQALGYIIDVYRGDVKIEKNFFRYALFVSFFPQLVAGPIERSKNLLSQANNLSNIALWDFKWISSGAILMIWGFF